MVQLPLTTLGQETRWAYTTTPRAATHACVVVRGTSTVTPHSVLTHHQLIAGTLCAYITALGRSALRAITAPGAHACSTIAHPPDSLNYLSTGCRLRGPRLHAVHGLHSAADSDPRTAENIGEHDKKRYR